MILIQQTQGNLADANWQDKHLDYQIDTLPLEQWEAPKNRLRKTSEGGIELAISLPREQRLHNDDVLYVDEENQRLVVAKVTLKDVLVIELEGLDALSHAELLKLCFELGHGLGNQHWPAVIKGLTVYVPLSVDEKVMASVMRTHAFKNVKTHFTDGESVASVLAPNEMRLLFAGADAVPHHHHAKLTDTFDQPHSHKHTHEHSHEHSHEHGHCHQHEHHDHQHGCCNRHKDD